jgi:hypothetical protein
MPLYNAFDCSATLLKQPSLLQSHACLPRVHS